MKLIKILFLQTIILGIFLPACAWSAIPDESYKITKLYNDVVVNDDGTETDKVTLSMTVLREDAINGLKQYTITYSTSAEKVDVLEAYTQKAGGRRIDASRENFQLQVAGGRKDAPPAFSDQTSLTVVFPDVAAGDTVNLIYTRMVTDPIFPKQISVLHSFPKNVLYDDARISYSVPLSLNARYKNFGLTEIENKKENERQLLAWTFKNSEVKKTKYVTPPVTEIGDIPAIAISTFPSYAAITKAYGERANPKAKVTNQIQELANQITKSKVSPRDQVEALYNWEINNITYAGQCIGLGSVVPRDLDFVLKNKMGDCKDQATLFQALLSAKGIESTQALIGVNNIYTLPDIPLIGIVNHVINYIPSLKLYADATSGMPFGYLSLEISGKPVLLVNGYQDGTKTPNFPPEFMRTKIDAKVTIAEDGSADGVTTVATTSSQYGSHGFQQQLKNTTTKNLDDASENALKQSGFQGSVKIDNGIWDEKTMTFTVSIHYHLKDYVHIGTPGALNTASPFSPQTIANLTGYLIAGLDVKDADKLIHGFPCSGDYTEENYQYILPKTMDILALPKDVSASTSVQNYTSKYSQSGQIINVSRVRNDTTPGPVCAAEIQGEYQQLALKIGPI